MKLVPTPKLIERVEKSTQTDDTVYLLCVLMDQDDSSGRKYYREGEELLKRVADYIECYSRVGWSAYWAVLREGTAEDLANRLRPTPLHWTVVSCAIAGPVDPHRKTFGRLDAAAHELAKTHRGHLHVIDNNGELRRSVSLT